MTRGPKYASATDLPDELKSVGAINAYEIGPDLVRVACQLSDEDETVGQLAILHVSMTTGAVAIEKTFDDIYMSFQSDRGLRDILLVVGNIVQVRAEGGWDFNLLESRFLIEAFTLADQADFAFGSDGDIFRRLPGGVWLKDPVPTDNRIMAMHGTSLADLHAVGGAGTILRAEGAGWRQIDAGLGRELRCVLVEGDAVTVAGDRGVAGQLRGDEFVHFETGIESDILSICRFRGDLYFADSEFGVHVLKGTAFEPVLEYGYVYRLQPGPERMTATSAETILQFDGKGWRAIELGHSTTYTAEPVDLEEE